MTRSLNHRSADERQKEAAQLTLASPADTAAFAAIKTTFASLPPAKWMGELAWAQGEPRGQASHAICAKRRTRG